MPKIRVGSWQLAALYNPFQHFAFYAGVAGGKTYTGAQFAIRMMREHPDLTGFIGANTYDQLSQATLRELFYWLDDYGMEYVIDCKPPRSWNSQRLKSYKNVLSVRVGPRCVSVFTRVLGDGDPLRGIEFSWYWMDESRDTPQNTHDILLSRMREDRVVMKGLMTSTTNGEDWGYKRFVLGNNGDMIYGSQHIPTQASLDAGIITEAYYKTLLRSYSELLAEQELYARHVNVLGGRAYYAAGRHNDMMPAPWGDLHPSRDRPLVVGCDFNFQPSPCVWMVGQVGPALWSPRGEYWSECIHWFGELSHVQTSTADMTATLMARYPGYFYQIFGDMSGNQGTTSNAGETDYNQISAALSTAGCGYSIDAYSSDEKNNPRVKARVENMNARFRNALGEIHQTFDPQRCPQFAGDLRTVGWKPNPLTGKGKLDNCGDVQRTHASDAAGYAVYKLFPPGQAAQLVDTVASPYLQEIRNL